MLTLIPTWFKKLTNNQQGIPYIAGPKQEGMTFSGMIKTKLKFFKSMQNKITKNINIIFLSFLNFFFKKKRLRDT